MRFAIVISALLHVAAVGVWFILPDSWRPVAMSEPIVPIEVITEAELSDRLSVMQTRKEAEPEPEEAPAPAPVEEEEPAPIIPQTISEPEEVVAPDPEPMLPPEPVEEEEPEETEPEPDPEPDPPKPEPEPVRRQPDPKPEPKRPELDLAALESALEDLDREETENQPQETRPDTGNAARSDRDRNQVGLGDRLSASEEARMKSRMAECWSAQSFIGAPRPETLLVEVAIELNTDGSLRREPRVLNQLQIRTSGNPFWRVAERSAVNAVIECAPYDFLSPEFYASGKSIELVFNPAEMVGL